MFTEKNANNFNEILLARELDDIEHKNEEENKKWLRSEAIVEKKWQSEQVKLEAERNAKEAERKRIRSEFEAEQKRLSKLKEENERIFEENKRFHEELEDKIVAYINGDANMPEELNQKAETNPGKPICDYFAKAGACRFGNKCARNHCRPMISRILLIPSFFVHIRLDQGKPNEYGSELALEFEEDELKSDFDEFFEDVFPELQKFGKIKHFITSQNYDCHLKGNVYVEYASKR